MRKGLRGEEFSNGGPQCRASVEWGKGKGKLRKDVEERQVREVQENVPTEPVGTTL